jgi:hypothetical protein
VLRPRWRKVNPQPLNLPAIPRRKTGAVMAKECRELAKKLNSRCEKVRLKIRKRAATLGKSDQRDSGTRACRTAVLSGP